MTTNDIARAQALAWLHGRLRFEQLLADLQQRSDAATVDPDVPAAKAA